MYLNYALPLGIAFSVIMTTGPVGANPTDQKMPLAYLDDQSQVGRDQNPHDEPTGTLVLPQVLALALTQNPELAAFSWETRAREAAALQASFFPNPTFGANAANFGNRSVQGFDGDVVTLELSQLIELGGKRAARTEAAALTKELADWDYESKRIDVLSQVSQAFIEVLSAQQHLALAQQTQELAKQMMVTTSARVQAGKVSPVEETKAKTALASVQIELMRAQRELEAARKHLAASWGSTAPRFDKVAGDLNTIQSLPSLESLFQRLANNPDLARWTTEITQRQALITMEKSKAVPDVTATLGASKFLMPDDYALVVGFSIPLPIFNRNQGGILEAEHRLTKAEEDRRSAEVRIATALNTAYQRLSADHAEVSALRQEVLPGAQSAYDAAREGYRLGKFGFLDVLDAQRTLFGAKNQYLLALADYHKSLIEVERLIGGSLNENSVNRKQEISQ
jgi:cobalt-zinc-cadmium efflux system outer membrane protein